MNEHIDTPAPRLRADAAERYCEDLLLALRVKEVPGRRIGAVLAEVRDHLASSGEDPVETFGTPQDYADALTAGEPAPPRPTRLLEWARNTAGVAGALWTVEGGAAFLAGRQATLTEFQLVLPAVIALVAPHLVDAVVRASRAAVLGWGLLVTAGIAGVAVTHAWVGPLISAPVPAAVLLVPGLLVAAASMVSTARAVDPVVDPLQDAASTHRQRRRTGALLTALLLLSLTVPVAVSVALQHLG